jgi:hypothetical protein
MCERSRTCVGAELAYWYLPIGPLEYCDVDVIQLIKKQFWTSARATDPLMVKTLKLAIYLFLEFWLQIWFQKYYIILDGTQFLFNKHKNRGRF